MPTTSPGVPPSRRTVDSRRSWLRAESRAAAAPSTASGTTSSTTASPASIWYMPVASFWTRLKDRAPAVTVSTSAETRA